MFASDEVYDACRGGNPPLTQFSSPLDKGGEEKSNIRKIAQKNGVSGIYTAISVHVWIQTWRQRHPL